MKKLLKFIFVLALLGAVYQPPTWAKDKKHDDKKHEDKKHEDKKHDDNKDHKNDDSVELGKNKKYQQEIGGYKFGDSWAFGKCSKCNKNYRHVGIDLKARKGQEVYFNRSGVVKK